VALFGLLADPEAVHRPIEMLGGLVPGSATTFLADQMQVVARTSRTQLGAGLGGAALEEQIARAAPDRELPAMQLLIPPTHGPA
jgi:hypothetical protein